MHETGKRGMGIGRDTETRREGSSELRLAVFCPSIRDRGDLTDTGGTHHTEHLLANLKRRELGREGGGPGVQGRKMSEVDSSRGPVKNGQAHLPTSTTSPRHKTSNSRTVRIVQPRIFCNSSCLAGNITDPRDLSSLQ